MQPKALSKPYNIVWLAIDSLKATAMPTHSNPYVQAPNALRAANSGIVFENAFVQMPKCVPSRPSQMTGRYPHADGMRALLHTDRHANGHFVIQEGMPNLISELKVAGYDTCHKGVNHLLSWDLYNSELMTETTDWDAYKQCKKASGTCEDPQLKRAYYQGNLPSSFDPEQHTDAEATRQLCEFLGKEDRKQKPFFAYLDIRAAHPPYLNWEPYASYYRDLDIPCPPKASLSTVPVTERIYRETYALEDMPEQDWVKLLKAYYSAISYNDTLVGRILDTLEAAGLKENTIVLYTSDHGDLAGEHGCTEKHDTILYDALVHLPLIMQLPKGFATGRRYAGLLEMIDIAPTLLELCELPIPPSMQGRSFATAFEDLNYEHKDAVFSQGGVEIAAIEGMLEQGPGAFQDSRSTITTKQAVGFADTRFMQRAKMIRTHTHKYIHRANGEHELYALQEDPLELDNRLNDPSMQTILQKLRLRLIDGLLEQESNLPIIEKLVL